MQHGHPTKQPLIFGFALAGGLGLTLMMVALGIGVVQGTSADDGLIGGLFIGGLLALIAGISAWIAVVRPFESFDDIDKGLYTGHHGHDASDDHADADAHDAAADPAHEAAH